MSPDRISEATLYDANRQQCAYLSGIPRDVLDRWFNSGMLITVGAFEVAAEVRAELARRDEEQTVRIAA